MEKDVPYIVYEASLAREERQQKRLVAVIIFLIVLLFVSNAVWTYLWSQYDYVDDYGIDINSGEGGIANYIGNDGDINNGTDNNTQEKDKGAS